MRMVWLGRGPRNLSGRFEVSVNLDNVSFVHVQSQPLPKPGVARCSKSFPRRLFLRRLTAACSFTLDAGSDQLDPFAFVELLESLHQL